MGEPGEATAQPSVKRLARARGEAPAVVPPPGPVAATRTAKGVKPDAKPGAPRGGGIAKAGAAAAASGLRASGAVAKAAGAPSIKAGRKPNTTVGVVSVALASVRAATGPGGKTAPRARAAEQASRPAKPATAGQSVPKERVSKAPRASGTSAQSRCWRCGTGRIGRGRRVRLLERPRRRRRNKWPPPGGFLRPMEAALAPGPALRDPLGIRASRLSGAVNDPSPASARAVRRCGSAKSDNPMCGFLPDRDDLPRILIGPVARPSRR